MEEELTKLFDVVKRTKIQPSEEKRCLAGLKKLGESSVNYDVLFSTKIANKLAALTKQNCSDKIKTATSKVLDIWKEKINEEFEVNFKLYPTRSELRASLSKALCKVSSEVNVDQTKSKPCDVSVLVEKAMFDKWGKLRHENEFEYETVVANIEDPRNPDFRRKVLFGEIKPEEVPNLTQDEMVSEKLKEEIAYYKHQAMREKREVAAKQSTNEILCGRCKKTKDPMSAYDYGPMPTFVTCTKCKKIWKFCF